MANIDLMNQVKSNNDTYKRLTKTNRALRNHILTERRRRRNIYRRQAQPLFTLRPPGHPYYTISEHVNNLLTNQTKLNRFKRRCILVWKRLGRLRRRLRITRTSKRKHVPQNQFLVHPNTHLCEPIPGTQLPEPMHLNASIQLDASATHSLPKKRGRKRKSRSDDKCPSTSSTLNHDDRQSPLPKSNSQKMRSRSDIGCSKNSGTTNHIKPHGVSSSNVPFPEKNNGSSEKATTTEQINLSSENKRVFVEPWNFGGPTDTCEFCDVVVWAEESVGNCTNGRRKYSICCQKGKVTLPLLKDPPEYLQRLIDPNGGPESKKFRQLIRAYNTIFAFTSMGGQVDNAINKGSAPYCFRLGGQNHHNIGSLVPPEGKQPRFMQLYFYDNEHEVAQRINSLGSKGKSELDPCIVEGLSKMIYEDNVIAKSCKMARERIHTSVLQPVQLRLIGDWKKDGRQYNLPTTDELAALIVGSGEREKGCRDIVIYDRARGVKRISELHPSFMAMQYPLIFPYGEDGYKLDIKHKDAETSTRKRRTYVTMKEYYAYRFQERRKGSKLIDGICVLCGRLRQQFLVDAFTCVEEMRLDYIRSNQKDIRKYSLRGLIDVVGAGATTTTLLGQRIILPPSFPGGYRFLFQNYQDALAICRWAGPPDLFITFTCNPQWPETKEFLAAILGNDHCCGI